MNLKIGIIGMPNAGKSTLFNALIKKQVAFAANYPFATIEPNIGIVPVPDHRLAALADAVESEKGVRPPTVAASVEFVDIAGLVAGAAEGAGLGNKFLAHIREVHLVCHVIRFFTDPAVVHVTGTVDPQRDRDTVETELILADLETLAKQSEPKGVRDREQLRRWELIGNLRESLNSGTPAARVLETAEDAHLVTDLHLITAKPVLYVANVSEEQLEKLSPDIPGNYLPVCAKLESELAGLPAGEQTAYLKSVGYSLSGLDRLIKRSYEMLGLISFLTAGVKEVRAWTVKKGTVARQASGVIHTDFEKKFIKADVVTFVDFISHGGWKVVREAGIVRQEGRDYPVRDGDVIEFKIGT
ncbi:redox-regulated ATPase YchF [Candidatus Gottesmanbacteria bacterium RBG_16_52_11]|uniref:Ribosome-binding ATPase YchF n=1 Tax=Candidatus Gottesmanbacteria bacterium RBG_16_52_11 TaxID=1798374 RepID=A0A1F5YP10_9BACT|nr:MAG: redox-regulated ATPase YchF [Candidatus Gottesmanbacteria bacterium RBG_16_52_11]